MEIYYHNVMISRKSSLLLSMHETKKRPVIIINQNPIKYYTLLMFDPNAVGGNKIHWLIINIIHNNISNGNEIINYKGPMPPKKSGKHYYTFCLFEQLDVIHIDTNLYRRVFENRFIELYTLFKILKATEENFRLVDMQHFISENS